MITIKLPYTNNSQEFKDFLLLQQKEFSCVLRYAFNRFLDENSEKEIRGFVKTLNNIKHIDSWIIQSAIKKAQYLYKTSKNKKLVFGGKKNFIKRSQNRISKEEFLNKRLSDYCSIGEAPQKGNRKFQLNIIEENSIIWKPQKGTKFVLTLPKLRKNYKKLLIDLQNKTEMRCCPVTISINDNFIFFIFEESKQEKVFSSSGNHVGIDLNPNFISCVFKNENSDLLHSCTFNLSKLTTKNSKNNKLSFETYEISKELSKLFQQYNISFVFIEDLSIKIQNHNKGKFFNRLVNNKWERNKFISNLKKRCESIGISLFEINPSYSSFIGNLIFNELPDPIAAACEIARRGYEVIIKKTKEFYPNFEHCIFLMKNQWKELTLKNNIHTWKDLFSFIKNSKLKYRISWDDTYVFRKFHSFKSKCLICNKSYI